MHMHMLDTHELGAALAQMSESLDRCNANNKKAHRLGLKLPRDVRQAAPIRPPPQ
jgi:hypothetical protein